MRSSIEIIIRNLNYRAIAAICIALILLSSDRLVAQPAQLTLADLLIGLRSKKVSLDERNEILSGAVAARGVTFSLTPEIERELLATGAKQILIDSIRKKAPVVKMVPVSTAEPKPAPPPDYSFYEKRGASSATAGNLADALADYTKAIEMNPAAISSYLGRGAINLTNGSLDLAINDFNAVLEKLPKNSVAIAGRASAYEKAGKLESARDDFAKLVELEPDNQPAKANLSRIQVELDKIAEAQKPKPEPSPVVASPVKPDMITVGDLSEADAVKLVRPVYSQMASRAKIGGKVTVEITIDKDGKVTSAKAVSGSLMLKAECESAALRSQFKPQMWNGEPIAAKGHLTYNFVVPQ
jgi:TonB family protein